MAMKKLKFQKLVKLTLLVLTFLFVPGSFIVLIIYLVGKLARNRREYVSIKESSERNVSDSFKETL
jgi:hypothetical protein